jgi:oligopeptide transport system permease protein
VTRKLRWVYAIVLGLCLGATVLLSFLAYEVPAPLKWMNVSLLLAGFVVYTLVSGLTTYVLRRVGEAIFVLLVIATLTFLLLRFVPGGPFDSEKALPQEVLRNLEKKYNLDQPLYVQYFQYLGGLIQGDLGQSYKFIGRGVTDIISETFPNSFQLGVFALIIAFSIGIPIGVIAAARHNSYLDNAAMFFAISGVSLPSFVVASVAVYFFSMRFPLFPVAGWEGTSYYILPVLVLGIRPAAVIARLTRSTVLEVISSDYIRTARAKGLSQFNILFKHVLKNSLIPVLTFSGPLVAGVLSGSFVIEHIFNINGMGKHLIQSVGNRDYPLILGVTLLFSAMLVFANLIVDLLYSFFDPRIRLS